MRRPAKFFSVRRRATRRAIFPSTSSHTLRVLSLDPLDRRSREGEYPDRKSSQDVKLINVNLNCNENFAGGFGVSEFIVTPSSD